MIMSLFFTSFGFSLITAARDICDLMVERIILQDAVGVGENLTDVPLHPCCEGIHFVRQVFSDLTQLAFPLLDVKSNDLN